jgi:hypothetical protein
MIPMNVGRGKYQNVDEDEDEEDNGEKYSLRV